MSLAQMSELPTAMHVDLSTLAPLPALKTQCGPGEGLAVCATLGLLVTSDSEENSLSVFALPGGFSMVRATADGASGAGAGSRAGLHLVGTLGGAGARAPMQFQFRDASFHLSGHLAFTPFSGGPTSRLLLVTDAGHDAVHVIDIVRRVHVGHVAVPGAIAGPRGVACRGFLAAVSSWVPAASSSGSRVHLFEGSGHCWEPLFVVDNDGPGPRAADRMLWEPSGLRFNHDCTELAVTDVSANRVSLFQV